MPVSAISGALGMTKSALYKHYAGKRDIFDTILERMRQGDAAQAEKYGMPDDGGGGVEPKLLRRYIAAQFRYWTEEEFPACFRRLITLEQYRSREMMGLYQQYLGAGPLAYTAGLLLPAAKDHARADAMALELYGPMFLLYTIYDGGGEAFSMLQDHLARFFDRPEFK